MCRDTEHDIFIEVNLSFLNLKSDYQTEYQENLGNFLICERCSAIIKRLLKN